eukprot:scaffold19219_cov101-Isochrysis_galbana.AAC.1
MSGCTAIALSRGSISDELVYFGRDCRATLPISVCTAVPRATRPISGCTETWEAPIRTAPVGSRPSGPTPTRAASPPAEESSAPGGS